jgi:hypothetical protein
LRLIITSNTKLFEIDQSIEEMGFELLNISTELNGAVKKQGIDSHRYKAFKDEQMNIQEIIQNRKISEKDLQIL